MSADETAKALVNDENAARAALFASLRKARRKATDVDPKDADAVKDLADETGEAFATIVRTSSERASRSGIEAAKRDTKAAIGGAVLGFLAIGRFVDREERAIQSFARSREEHTRRAIAEAVVKKTALHGDVSTAMGLLKSRADTIAISETAMGITHGYVTEARTIVDAFAARPAWLVLEWIAVLDRRTCSVCYGYDGKTCAVGDDFDGFLPGFVHARCRCFLHMRRA